jgi:cobalt/nickel transport system permease protein
LVPAFFTEPLKSIWVLPLLEFVLLISCINLIRKLKQELIVVAYVGLLSILARWFSLVIPQYHSLITVISRILYLVIIILVTYEIFRMIFYSRRITFQILYGAITGFLQIGVIGFILYLLIENIWPGSFNNLNIGQTMIDDLLYFSFVTLLTVGYGDITPVSQAAKITSVLLGLAGQFYLVIIIGIILGKYLSRPHNKI